MPEKFVPFDPSRHQPIRLPDGSVMTERLATEYVSGDSGAVWNIPTVWFDSSGRGKEVSVDQAMELARNYEKSTGLMFPRFSSIDEAVSKARSRSARGGASNTALASQRGRKLLLR